MARLPPDICSNGGDETQDGKEHPLTVGGDSSAHPSEQTGNPVIPPPTPNKVVSDPNQASTETRKIELREPISVAIVRDTELSKFEAKTVTFGKVGVIVAVLSFIAASGAAYFVLQQLKEMAAQTELLGRGARQSRSDANDSSIATTKQLSALQEQIAIAQKGAAALQGQVIEVRRSANVAARQLELTDRAWIKIVDVTATGDGDIIPSLSFQDLTLSFPHAPKQQTFLNYAVHAKNVGHSAALDIQVIPELYLAKWHDGYAREVENEEKRFCDLAMKDKTTIAKGGAVIFPDEPYENNMGNAGLITPDAMNHFSDLPGETYILPVLIGCVDYQFQSSSKHHQTRFVYELFHAEEPRTRFFLVGKGVKARDLLLIRNVSDDYAD
jgi:hypothetical protein